MNKKVKKRLEVLEKAHDDLIEFFRRNEGKLYIDQETRDYLKLLKINIR